MENGEESSSYYRYPKSIQINVEVDSVFILFRKTIIGSKDQKFILHMAQYKNQYMKLNLKKVKK